MSLIKLEGEKEGFKFLKKTGCCLRCCFRFFGNRTLEYYLSPVESARKVKYILEKLRFYNDYYHPFVVKISRGRRRIEFG